jgi:CBS domain-containing protein
MVRRPTVLSAAAALAEVRGLLADGHVHMVLLTDGPRLRGTLVRSDLPATVDGCRPALPFARTDGRTVTADAAADEVLARMVRTGERRLAVVDGDGTLLGLLCRTRRGDGFCSDADVAARRCDPRSAEVAPAQRNSAL